MVLCLVNTLWQRPRGVKVKVLSVSTAVYLFLFPDFVGKTYILHTLSGIKITGIPVEEFVFYFLFGLAIIPMYDYWQDLSLRNIVKK